MLPRSVCLTCIFLTGGMVGKGVTEGVTGPCVHKTQDLLATWKNEVCNANFQP